MWLAMTSQQVYKTPLDTTIGHASSQEDTSDLKQIMCDAARAAESLEVTIIGGHTEAPTD